jgi:hypothetical protein
LRQKRQAGGWRRAAEAQRWLTDAHGIVVGLATVYKYLKKLGARLKVPRPCHQKHDPAAAAAFKASLAQRLRDLKLLTDRPVRLWVADEMRYGLLPVTRRVWTLKGVRAVVSVHPRYQWGYPFGALQVGAEGTHFCYCSAATLAMCQAFLQQLAAREPEALPVRGALGWGRVPPQRRGLGPTRQRALDRLSALPSGVEPRRETLGPS